MFKSSNVFLESVNVLSSLCMPLFLMCKVRSVTLLTAVYPEILHFVLVIPLKETKKVVLLVITVMQFHFYMT